MKITLHGVTLNSNDSWRSMQRIPNRRADDADGWRKAKYSCRASAAADAPTKAANREIGAPRKYSVVKERAGSRQESGREHPRHYQAGRLRDARLLTVRSTGVQLVAAHAFATAPLRSRSLVEIGRRVSQLNGGDSVSGGAPCETSEYKKSNIPAPTIGQPTSAKAMNARGWVHSNVSI